MSRIRSSGTKPERRLYRMVREILGHRWRIDRNVSELPGQPDVLVPTLRLTIFADGCFFHCCPTHGHIPKSNQAYWEPKLERNVKRDQMKRRELRSLGYAVWRFWGHDLTNVSLATTHRLLEHRLGRRVRLWREGGFPSGSATDPSYPRATSIGMLDRDS